MSHDSLPGPLPSPQESIRPLATECIRAVSERLQDPEAVSAFALSLVKILEGGAEGGKVGE